MICTSPISGWMKQGGGLTTSLKDAWLDKPLTIRCGNCQGCRKTKALNWGIRCFHESQFHEFNSFITPTFDDEHLPSDGSLRRYHVQQFVRRLRKAGHKHRYQFAGEYGPKTKRPHYHGSIFGYRPNDLEKVRDGEKPLFRSPSLEKIWGQGKVDVMDFTLGTALYTAQYVLKKMGGKLAVDEYQHIDPETGEITEKLSPFQLQSNRPGLGEEWIKTFMTDVYPNDFLVIDGQKYQPPAYYDKKCAELFPKLWERTLQKRQKQQAAQWKTETRNVLIPRRLSLPDREKRVRVKKDPNAYKGSDRHMLARSKIQASRQSKRDSLDE